MTTDLGQLFGRGVSFPPGIDRESRVGWSEGPENIRESIRIILTTEPGERLMLPGFGAGLKRFLFEPNTVTTYRQLEEVTAQSLRRWEPRIRVSEIVVRADDEDPQAALISIRYSLVSDGASDQVLLRVQLGA